MSTSTSICTIKFAIHKGYIQQIMFCDTFRCACFLIYFSREVQKRTMFRSSSSRFSVAPVTCSQEKEKLAKFANGSLLGNDSRIFVQHHGPYPLSRMRPSSSASSHSLFLFVSSSLSFRPFLFFKVLPSRDAGIYLIPSLSTSSFLESLVLPLLLYTLDFVCISYFFSFEYHLGFCNNNISPTPITVSLYIRFSRIFLFFVISISFIS